MSAPPCRDSGHLSPPCPASNSTVSTLQILSASSQQALQTSDKPTLPPSMLTTLRSPPCSTYRRCCRLPATTRFCAFHPVKLFDFSTRARCLTPFRVLGLSGPGTAQPQNSPLCMDLEAVPALSAAQLAWHREETAKLEDELHQVRIVGIAPKAPFHQV